MGKNIYLLYQGTSLILSISLESIRIDARPMYQTRSFDVWTSTDFIQFPHSSSRRGSSMNLNL